MPALPEGTPPDVREAAERFLADNPGIGHALETFNVSFEQYQSSLAAQTTIRTYVNSYTLLPGKHG